MIIMPRLSSSATGLLISGLFLVQLLQFAVYAEASTKDPGQVTPATTTTTPPAPAVVTDSLKKQDEADEQSDTDKSPENAKSTALEPLYKPCDPKENPSSCGKNLICQEYGKIYKDKEDEVSVCDCPQPTDTPDTSCSCTTAAGVLRKWLYSKGEQRILPKPEGHRKWPAGGFTRAGCYLENGELCSMADHTDKYAETYNTCCFSHYCESIAGNGLWGFCRRSSAPRSLHSTRLPLYLLGLGFLLTHYYFFTPA